ncbi:MAG: hypothetical protein RI936_818, partial [Pseudomonadota bacterium]
MPIADTRPAADAATAAGGLQAGHGPLVNESALEFRHGGENVEDESPRRPSRVDGFC